MSLSEMTFFERFEADILSGKKTITIRNETERDFIPNTEVQVSTFESHRWFCAVNIISITPITFDGLNSWHAEQENMTLNELKAVIREIYPTDNEFYVIEYQVTRTTKES